MEKAAPKEYDAYIKGLMDISRAITSELFLEDILKLIVLVTAKVTGVDICSLWLVEEGKNPNKKVIRLAATQAMDPDYVIDRTLCMGEGVVGHVAQTNTALILEKVLDDPRFKEKEMARKLELVSMASVPMTIGGEEVIGVLNCFTCNPHNFPETEINLIRTVANQASLAIHNARLMVRTKVIEQELATRKVIERAKEIVMARKGLTGDKAFRWIQKKSMDNRKTMKEIAEAIILSEDM
ncbi:GAF domain-containing protein [Desulfatibacillum aliphaticivorans]|uniref:GAF domain-containing protein n=1 Tax=Desulfatibacillum aliphaticivorans TaxID=218208 RepID=UPI00041E6C33|nr:GAF domain-containing protein [Desulfatibacillum aliphaticivorans]